MPVTTYQVQPGARFIAIIGGAPNEVGALDPNLPPADLPAGALGVQVVPLAGGAPVVARTAAGVHQQLPGSGIYSVELTAPLTLPDGITPATGDYSVLWDHNGGSAPFYAQTLSIDTTIPIAVGGGSSTQPVYVQIGDPTDIANGVISLASTIPGLVVDDAATLNMIIVEAELEIDSIIGFWIRDPFTGRKVNLTNVIPEAPISPFPGELFAPYQRGVTLWQKAALQRAVCAQVEYHLTMGEEFFRKPQYEQVSGPKFSRQGKQPYIAPKARQHLAQMGVVRRVARATV